MLKGAPKKPSLHKQIFPTIRGDKGEMVFQVICRLKLHMLQCTVILLCRIYIKWPVFVANILFAPLKMCDEEQGICCSCSQCSFKTRFRLHYYTHLAHFDAKKNNNKIWPDRTFVGATGYTCQYGQGQYRNSSILKFGTWLLLHFGREDMTSKTFSVSLFSNRNTDHRFSLIFSYTVTVEVTCHNEKQFNLPLHIVKSLQSLKQSKLTAELSLILIVRSTI